MDQEFKDFIKKNSETNDEDIDKEIEEMIRKNEEEEYESFDDKMNIIIERLKEYENAYNYFEENHFHKQQENAEKCINIINKIKKEMEKGKKNGKWKKVNLSLLPKEITPEYIYDCTY